MDQQLSTAYRNWGSIVPSRVIKQAVLGSGHFSLWGCTSAADLARADTPNDAWAMAYPRSARCVPRQRARAVWLDLRDKLRQPQTYVPTTYHWLLIYECLHFHIECLNGAPGLHVVDGLKALRAPQDAAYLAFPRDGHGREGVSIAFAAFIDTYFWDINVLFEPSTYAQLGAPAKQQLGYRADLFGVVLGLLPHPAALVLKTLEEVEATGPEGGADYGKLS